MNLIVSSLEFGSTRVGLPDRDISSEDKERVFLEVTFSIDKISRLQDLMLKVFISLECTVKRLLYRTWIFLIGAIGLCTIAVSLLLSVVSQKKQEPSSLGVLGLSQS